MTNEATRLAACPFCGSDKISEDFGDESGCVRCRNCGCQSGRVFFTEAEKESDDFSQSEADAREAWNRRATLAQPAVSEDALTERDMFTLIGHAQVCDSDMRKYFLDLATRLARSRGDAAGAARCAQLAAMASQEKPHD